MTTSQKLSSKFVQLQIQAFTAVASEIHTSKNTTSTAALLRNSSILAAIAFLHCDWSSSSCLARISALPLFIDREQIPSVPSLPSWPALRWRRCCLSPSTTSPRRTAPKSAKGYVRLRVCLRRYAYPAEGRKHPRPRTSEAVQQSTLVNNLRNLQRNWAHWSRIQRSGSSSDCRTALNGMVRRLEYRKRAHRLTMAQLRHD